MNLEVVDVLEIGAGNEIRTRDPDLGKVVLYQLSYSRTVDVSAETSRRRDSSEVLERVNAP